MEAEENCRFRYRQVQSQRGLVAGDTSGGQFLHFMPVSMFWYVYWPYLHEVS